MERRTQIWTVTTALVRSFWLLALFPCEKILFLYLSIFFFSSILQKFNSGSGVQPSVSHRVARDKTALYWQTVVHARHPGSPTSYEGGAVKYQSVPRQAVWPHVNLNTSCFLLKVNKTFEDLQILQELNESWMEVGPQIKTYMESSVEIQLLRVRTHPLPSMSALCLSFGNKKNTHVCMCMTGSVEAAGSGGAGQLAPGEHVLDRLPYCTLPVHALAGHSKEPQSSDNLAGHLQWHQPHHHNSRTSHRGTSLPQTLLSRRSKL